MAEPDITAPKNRFKFLGYLHLGRYEWPEEDQMAHNAVDVGVGVCERCGVVLHWATRKEHRGCKERTWRA